MLKQWLSSNGDIQSIDVEEKYESWVQSLRTDRYVTVWALSFSQIPMFFSLLFYFTTTCDDNLKHVPKNGSINYFCRNSSKVTEFQLEKIYGKGKDAKAFIATLISGQKGTPHPQAWL